MKQVKAYMGEFKDKDIENVLPTLIDEANQTHELIWLEWNGVFVWIDETVSVDDCLEQYHRSLHKKDVFTEYENGKLINVDNLSKKIADYLCNLIK